MSNNIYRYYVYAYLRPDGTPYYIGKGCNNRAYKKHRHISVPKNRIKIVFLETNLSNVGACALERRYIEWYGRKDLGTGILRNMTDGGEGVEGHIHSQKTKDRIRDSRKDQSSPNKGKTTSSEHRAKLSAANKGKSPPNKGRPLSPEHRAKLSAANKGKKHTIETRIKMSSIRIKIFATRV